MFKRLVPYLILAVTLVSCDSHKDPVEPAATLFQYIPAEHSGLHFMNVVKESMDRNIGDYDYFYNGGGVVIADFNNDDLPDLFFTGNDCSNAFYINKGNLEFEDQTTSWNLHNQDWCTGACAVDINNDGFLDLYVCVSGPDWKQKSTKNKLYINQGGEGFVEAAEKYGIDNNGLSTQANFFDADNDGDLDLFVMNHGIRNWANSSQDWISGWNDMEEGNRKRFSNAFYLNEGNDSFKEATEQWGVQGPAFGLGTAVADFNEDGYLDLFVGNDYFLPDRYYINQKGKRFSDQSSSYFAHTSFYSMGCDVEDIDNNGSLDLAVVDMTPADHVRSKTMMSSMNTAEFDYLHKGLGFTPQYMFNTLFLNRSKGVMSDVAHMAGVAKSGWSWAPLLADYDGDGSKDLFISNGILKDVKNNDWRLKLLDLMLEEQLNDSSYYDLLGEVPRTPIVNNLFMNQGGYSFEDQALEFGLNKTSYSNGAAYGDLDGDGDLDLVVNNIEDEAFVIRNNASEAPGFKSYSIVLKDSEGKHRHQQARVLLKTESNQYTFNTQFNKGYQSYCEPRLIVPVPNGEQVSSLEVLWLSGEQTSVLPENSVLTIDYAVSERTKPSEDNGTPLFWNISREAIQPPFFHTEDDFNDFKDEILLPHRMSDLGPALAVGDINGDGMDDFFVGGAAGQTDAIYLQVNPGYFALQTPSSFADAAATESLGACFLDVENDGDLDLYIACGASIEAQHNQDRLYINDGKGNFIKQSLPKMVQSSKAIQAADVDLDGDLDLIVAARNVPGSYPRSGSIAVLLNEDGTFNQRMDVPITGVDQSPMVTDMLWGEFDGEIGEELLVVGEWSSPMVIKWTDQGFSQVDIQGLTDNEGWWMCIEKGDWDNDGDEDILLGNWGWNSKFHPSKTHPLYGFAEDFDDNGSTDFVLSVKYKDQLVPVRGKECSSQQMPFIVDSFPSYMDFAQSTLDDIYGADQTASSYKVSATNFSSSILIQESPGTWRLEKLSPEYQISCIQDACSYDFDQDGMTDWVVAGNKSQTEVETTPLDASIGLLAHGKKNSPPQTELSSDRSGIFIPGDLRAMQIIHLGEERVPCILAAKNNSRLNLLLYGGE